MLRGNRPLSFRTQLAISLRTRRGDRSQIAFAKRLAISQSTLARIESEEQNVTMDMLELICQRLKCGLSDLIPETDPRISNPIVAVVTTGRVR